MRITGWHVDGYGRFHDRGWHDLPAGLTVFHGPNEAGKSTLLSFLRSMLFGLRDGRASDPAIPPLAGGRHGGVLRIADADEAAWTIERHGRDLRLLDAAGTSHDEPALRRILGGVNRDVFEAVFAFGLRELEQLGGLDDDALRDQLFAAGLTGGGSSAHEALGALGKRVDRLYRPRGDSPLKALDDRLKDLRRQRREAVERHGEHGVLVRREADLGATLDELESRITGLRLERERLERLGRVWALLEPLGREREELARIAGGRRVTPADVTAARTADGAGSAARTQLGEAEDRRSTVAAELSGVVVDEVLVASAGALRELDREAPAHRDRLLALSGLRGHRARTADEARGAVADLGPGWDDARALAIDASLPVRREAERRAAAVAVGWADAEAARVVAEAARVEAEAARSAAEASRVDAEVARDAAEVARADAEVTQVVADGAAVQDREAGVWAVEAAGRGAGGPLPSSADLDRAAAAIPEVRAAVQDLIVRRSTLRQASDALDELRARTGRVVRSSPGSDDRARVSLLLLVAVLSVVVGVAIAATGQPLGGAGLVVVGVVVGWADRASRRGADAARAAAEAEAADADAHADRVRRQEERVAEERRAVDAVEALLREAGPRSGIDPEVLVAATSTGPVERRVAELDAVRSRVRAHDERVGASRDAERAALDARATAEAATDACREAEVVAEDAARAFRRWADDAGLPSSVAPDDAVALLQALERAQDAVRFAAAAASAEAEASDAVAAWTRRAGDVLADAGRPAPEDDHEAVLRALAETHAAAVEAVDLDARRARLLRQEAEQRVEVERLERRVREADERRDALLAAAGAPDLDALEQTRVRTDRRDVLSRSVAEREGAVRAAAGGGADGAAVVDEARTGDVARWSTRRSAHDAELPRLDDERTAVIAARADAIRAREALESSVDLPRIDGEIEEARADAARLLVELRTVVRARDLITRTLDAFVRDQQPTVLRDASAWFRRITEGRYREVRQAFVERRGKQVPTLQVVPASGAVLDPTELSRGTREQLYLALRLALARRTARDATPLPLVMDDVLVNVSPDRAAAVADVVAEVAREHQVLFFTCHPATRDLLVQAAGNAAGGASTGRDGLRVEELLRAG